MRKTTYSTTKQQPFVTSQDIVYVLVLIAISVVCCLLPAHGFGQQLPAPPENTLTDVFPALDSANQSAPMMAANTEPAPTSIVPPMLNAPAPAAAGQLQASVLPDAPAPASALTAPLTANPYTPVQPPQLPMRSPQLENAGMTDHPFRQYWGMPNDPQTKITGKPMTVAELFAGTCSVPLRCQLLQAYWELSGLLAIYHFRCETEQLASKTAGAQQGGMLTLLHEQRRTAEVEFIKQQWALAELLKQYKGRTLRESELPIPSDFPLYPRYETRADKIARSERTQYLGRMIPLQEQLIESKNGTWRAASEMAQSASQPLFVITNQRTTAFLDLTKAVIDYNKMIAEYALETIPPNVSTQQLVGAVVRKMDGGRRMADGRNELPPGGITLAQYESPEAVTAQPIQQMGYEYQNPLRSLTPASVPRESNAIQW